MDFSKTKVFNKSSINIFVLSFFHLIIEKFLWLIEILLNCNKYVWYSLNNNLNQKLIFAKIFSYCLLRYFYSQRKFLSNNRQKMQENLQERRNGSTCVTVDRKRARNGNVTGVINLASRANSDTMIRATVVRRTAT